MNDLLFRTLLKKINYLQLLKLTILHKLYSYKILIYYFCQLLVIFVDNTQSEETRNATVVLNRVHLRRKHPCWEKSRIMRCHKTMNWL